ncbi:hypothetical protein KY285_006778 [Solanum tuberosum]|nr:hypothetical protein KY285_006778 [Solanum tuberosum]
MRESRAVRRLHHSAEAICAELPLSHPINYEMQSSSGTENHKNLDTILNVTSGVLHFVGDSLVPDTIDKNCPEGAKVLQHVDKKFIPSVASKAPDVTDQGSFGWTH